MQCARTHTHPFGVTVPLKKKKKGREFDVLSGCTVAFTFGMKILITISLKCYLQDFVIQKYKGIMYPKIIFMSCLGCNRVPYTHKGTENKQS